jgi:hypothetical protein
MSLIKESGTFGRGKFTEDEELVISQALHKKLGPNYISQVRARL